MFRWRWGGVAARRRCVSCCMLVWWFFLCIFEDVIEVYRSKASISRRWHCYTKKTPHRLVYLELEPVEGYPYKYLCLCDSITIGNCIASLFILISNNLSCLIFSAFLSPVEWNRIEWKVNWNWTRIYKIFLLKLFSSAPCVNRNFK